jgi:hypothetical protein
MFYLHVNADNQPDGWRLEPTDGYIPVSDEVYQLASDNPTWVWNGTTMVAPPVPLPPSPYIPTSVTMRQARLQLNVLGLYTAVNNAISGMSLAAQIEWDYASSIDRANPLTRQIIGSLGWTEQQADEYFTAASQL